MGNRIRTKVLAEIQTFFVVVVAVGSSPALVSSGRTVCDVSTKLHRFLLHRVYSHASLLSKLERATPKACRAHMG
jgi:hypothetical protein